MKQLFRTLFLFAIVLFSSGTMFSQTIIDYQSWNPSSPPCNLFGSATSVPATINGSTGTVTHLTNIGQPTYSSADNAVTLACSYENTPFYRGTQFQISYDFRVGYRYEIKINAAVINTNNTGSNASVVTNLNNGGNGSNSACSGAQTISSATSGNLIQGSQINGSSYTDYPISYNTLSSNYSFLTIGAVCPAGANNSQTILIRKITITKILPPLTFTLSPSPVNKICGTALNQTFTVTSNIPPSATVYYLWNLGSSSNGWLYNGSAANTTITTPTNTLALTAPACGTTPNNIIASVTVDGTNYSIGTISVNNVLPTFTISGANSFCSGTENYSISNLPCSATVAWTSTPSGIVSISSSGGTAAVTKLADGIVTLTATISNACGSTPITVTKQNITVGTPSFQIGGVEVFYLNGSMFDYSPNGPGNSFSVCPNESLVFTPYFPSTFNQASITGHEWTVTGVSATDLSNASLSVVAPSTHPSYFSFTYRYQNTCGFSPFYNGNVSTRDCAGGEDPFKDRNPINEARNNIDNTNKIKMSFFPNPVNSSLNINISSSSIDLRHTKITITDISGRQVKQISTVSETNSIPVSTWANGTYVVTITDGKQKIVKKIVKN